MVQMIGTSGRSLLSLINSILDFSRLEAGQMPTQQTTFDLVALLAQVRAQMAVQANAKGLHLGLFVSSAVPGMIEGDRRHIEELLLNLAGNAIKFTTDGHVQINVEVAGDRNGKVRLRFEVRDTGIGIAPQAQAHIFNSFTQADETIIDRFGGTGLGLAICRELATLMGGSIAAESVEGEGATFRVALPLPRTGGPGDDAIAPTPDRAASVGEMQRSVRVLAAEDNRVNQIVIATLLEQLGAEVVIAHNGAEALELWQARPFDVILMDAQMPVMDGIEATRRIRAAEAEAGQGRIPIIALTADAMSHQLAAYEAAGMDGFVAKPIEVARLYEALETALAGRPENEVAASGASPS